VRYAYYEIKCCSGVNTSVIRHYSHWETMSTVKQHEGVSHQCTYSIPYVVEIQALPKVL